MPYKDALLKLAEADVPIKTKKKQTVAIIFRVFEIRLFLICICPCLMLVLQGKSSLFFHSVIIRLDSRTGGDQEYKRGKCISYFKPSLLYPLVELKM